MTPRADDTPTAPTAVMVVLRCAGRLALTLSVVALVALSAIITREARESSPMTALAAVDSGLRYDAEVPAPAEVITVSDPLVETTPVEPAAQDHTWPAGTRWFNGRPVRPAKTLMMKVTAYSPDHRSCGRFADGKTASLHSVETNNFKLVAADSRILPLGSMITVPGYDSDSIVPVLDRGGAIKGHRLDVLFPTHAAARKWGVRTLPVIVWEYVDGEPNCDFRAIRDSRN